MNKNNLARNLREIRKTMGISQLEMSVILDIDLRLYQKYEGNNTPDIRISTAIKIAGKLNITIDQLFK